MLGRARAYVNLAWSCLHSLVRVVVVAPFQFYWGCANASLVKIIRQNVNQSQLENPAKKASSKPMLFPYQRHNISRPGLLDDFLRLDFGELLHGYYTVDGLSQGAKRYFTFSLLILVEYHLCNLITVSRSTVSKANQ
jgi:hypothetical protein